MEPNKPRIKLILSCLVLDTQNRFHGFLFVLYSSHAYAMRVSGDHREILKSNSRKRKLKLKLKDVDRYTNQESVRKLSRVAFCGVIRALPSQT